MQAGQNSRQESYRPASALWALVLCTVAPLPAHFWLPACVRAWPSQVGCSDYGCRGCCICMTCCTGPSAGTKRAQLPRTASRRKAHFRAHILPCWPAQGCAAMAAAALTPRLPCAGTQAEHCPGQWSYRLGPCQGVELADQLWMSRYILQRISEVAGLVATLDPNPIPGAASSAPVRFSTRETRQAGSGMREISAHMSKLHAAHLHHMMLYGQHNSRRYSGGAPRVQQAGESCPSVGWTGLLVPDNPCWSWHS